MDIYQTLNLCEAVQYYAPLYCLNYTSKEATLSINHKFDTFNNYLFCTKSMFGYRALCILFVDNAAWREVLIDDGVYCIHCRTYEECIEAVEAYFN